MDDQQKTLINLLNPAFTLQFADRDFQVKKANIEQIQQYQLRSIELSKQKDIPIPVKDLDLLSYALFLILNKVDSSITERYVKENMRGNIDGLNLLLDLGFIDPQKAEMAKRLQEKLIFGNSSPILQTEQVGDQKKSEDSPLIN